MILSISSFIRLLRVANKLCLPFEIKVPNSHTQKAIAELELGQGKRFNNISSLMKDLNADDEKKRIGEEINQQKRIT